MRYKQPRRILSEVARKAASAKTRLEAIQLLNEPTLPRLGGYPSNSVCNLLWRVASDSKLPAGKRFSALSQLLITLAESALPERK